MSQFARPVADVDASTLWEGFDGSPPGAPPFSIARFIDEPSPPDDADYIRSIFAPQAGVSGNYTCSLSAITDPGVDTGFSWRVRLQREPNPGANVNVTVELRQDYVDEALPGTLIHSVVYPLATAWGTQVEAIPAAAIANITDFSSLFVRFIADQP